MNKHIQIREVPEETHRALKTRAASEGLSMSDYLKRLIERELQRPDWDVMAKRIEAMEPIELPVSPTEMIRQERDSR